MGRFLAVLVVAGGAIMAAPGYVGSKACRACHAAQFETQALSQHARALRPMAETDIPERLAARPLQERSGVAFSYLRGADGVAVQITRGAERVEALLEWAFGSGAQAVTPVGRYKGAYFEHRISYYRAPGQAARTIGHSGTPSASAEAALGVRQDGATITRCFSCHATGVEAGPSLAAMTPGVTCERCHGPGSSHVRGEGAMRRTASVTLCAECHRMPSVGGKEPEARDPASVRFQLVGLSASACYRVSGKLTCVSCHNPHEDAARVSGPYVAVCAGCHAAPACGPKAGGECLACHMRKSEPLPHLTFTDHRIRVYR